VYQASAAKAFAAKTPTNPTTNIIPTIDFFIFMQCLLVF
jgi:hypothetical protein